MLKKHIYLHLWFKRESPHNPSRIWKCLCCASPRNVTRQVLLRSLQENRHVILRCRNLSVHVVSEASVSTSHLMCLSITCCTVHKQDGHTHTHKRINACPGSTEHDTLLSTLVTKGTGIKFAEAFRCNVWLLSVLPAPHTAAGQCLM